MANTLKGHSVTLTPTQKLIEIGLGRSLEDDLRRRYVDNQMTLERISKDYGVSISTVARWLHNFEIPVRKQGPIPTPSPA